MARVGVMVCRVMVEVFVSLWLRGICWPLFCWLASISQGDLEQMMVRVFRAQGHLKGHGGTQGRGVLHT